MNLEKYNNIFTSLFDVKEEQLDDNFCFGKAPGWDSFAHMELIAQIEDSFGIIMETEDITHFGGYDNGKKILEKYGIAME
jgi:acyl carrier protein